jgi:hypothetical protein
MHAIVLSLVIATQGAGFEGSLGYSGDSCSEAGCGSECGGCDEGCAKEKGWFDCLKPCGPMPQTCYAPRYGCYPGNNRHMNRYPAFHGTYYRRPYNYRTTYDYPWHAELHEPTSLFSYNVEAEGDAEGGGESFDFGTTSDRQSRSFGDHPRGMAAPVRR